MLKTVETLIKKEKEKYRVPRKVQDVIPVQRIWNDGIFKTGKRYSKTFRFSEGFSIYTLCNVANATRAIFITQAINCLLQ